MQRLFAVFLCGVVTSARGYAQPVSPSRYTAAGQTLLTHRADAMAKAPAMSLGALIARTSGANAPDLTHVQQVAMLADGGLIAHSAIGPTFLHHFAPTGRFVRSIAKSGQGPGELVAPSGLAQRGDTVIAVDAAQSRISWFTPKGLARTAPVPLKAPIDLWMMGALKSGSLVTRTALTLRPRMKVPSRPLSEVWVIEASGARMQRIGSVPDMDVDAYPNREKPGPIPQPVVFTRVAQVAAWDSLIAVGDGREYGFDVWTMDGTFRARVQVPVARRPVTTAMREAERARLRDMAGGAGTEGGLARTLGAQRQPLPPAADSLPPYDALLTSPDGFLWVVDGRSPLDDRGGATAFRADGAIVGRFTWSGNRVPMAFGVDRVVMKETDEDGVVSLAIYRLQRR